MEPFRYHVLICTQQKLEDKAYCKERGGEVVLKELRRQVYLHQLNQQVQITPCGCLGLCGQGPNMVVYPDGVWYSGITTQDMKDIVHSHLMQGQPVERLRQKDMDQLHRAILQDAERTWHLEKAQQDAGVLPGGLRRLADDFRASRAFLTAVELDLFSAVGEGGGTIGIAEQIGCDPRATEMLLNALTSMGLLIKKDGQYFNTPDTGRYFRKGFPDDARAAIMHRVHMWDRWSTLTECVREGSAMRFDSYAAPIATQAYIAATHKIAMAAAPNLMASLNLQGISRVLDVGGGSGAYAVAALKAFPQATAELLDLPSVIRLANRYIREEEMEERVQLRAGDFMVDPLGTGFDLVLLSYVMHLNPLEAAKRLLNKAAEALVPGGRIVINDFILNTDKTLPYSATLQSLNLLVSTRGGSVYSEAEYRQFLQSAGFNEIEKISIIGPTDVMTARKP